MPGLFFDFLVVLVEEVVVREAGEVDFAGHGVKARLEFVDVGAFPGADKHAVIVHLRHPCGFEFVESYVAAFAGREVVGVFGFASKGVNLVENEEHGLVGAVAYLAQRLVDDFDLFFKVWVRYIDNMNEDVGLAHFVERRFERIDKMRRELADEADGIGEEEREVVDDYFAHRCVERCKEFVFGEYVALAQ